jgi:glycosyltransferase involved in cell wall biosynthesis
VSPRVSVVICTRDRPQDLDRCLKSISRVDYPDREILVVDNGPSDERAADVARQWGARYIAEAAPGLSKARNRGARECTGEIIAYIDDDATAEPGWLLALVAEFADPRVMIVTGRILPPEDTAAGSVNSVPEDSCCSPSRRVVDSSTPAWFEISNFGGVGIGANMSVRRSAFDVWPGFDERLGRGATIYGAEDNYAFFSLIRRGYRVVYTPGAKVHHRILADETADRSRYLQVVTGKAAYVCFLLWEEPAFRLRTFKYLARRLGGGRLTWREDLPRGISPGDAIVRKLIAGAQGAVLFAQSRTSQARKTPEAKDAIRVCR